MITREISFQTDIANLADEKELVNNHFEEVIKALRGLKVAKITIKTVVTVVQ